MAGGEIEVGLYIISISRSQLLARADPQVGWALNIAQITDDFSAGDIRNKLGIAMTGNKTTTANIQRGRVSHLIEKGSGG